MGTGSEIQHYFPMGRAGCPSQFRPPTTIDHSRLFVCYIPRHLESQQVSVKVRPSTSTANITLRKIGKQAGSAVHVLEVDVSMHKRHVFPWVRMSDLLLIYTYLTTPVIR